MNNSEKPYRKNVGIIVFNSQGKVLVGDRVDYPKKFQFPQGGIDEGESPLEAAKRELYEEVGLKVDNPFYEVPEWLTYEFPEDIPEHLKKYRGQIQKWFFFRWDGDISKLSLNNHQQEFLSIQWMDFDELVEHIVPFKKEVYKKLYQYFQQNIKNKIQVQK